LAPKALPNIVASLVLKRAGKSFIFGHCGSGPQTSLNEPNYSSMQANLIKKGYFRLLVIARRLLGLLHLNESTHRWLAGGVGREKK
jgi:hypothetical protein